jgi:phosphatidylinositol phospholipase C delta
MEVHCCVEQQDLLAQIILDVLGSTFLSTPLADYVAAEALPSPDQLKYKILLKVWISEGPIGCVPRELKDLLLCVNRPRFRSSRASRRTRFSTCRPPTPTRAAQARSPLVSRARLPLPSQSHQGPKFKFSPALAKLLVYTIGVKYRGFNKKEVYPSSNMISLSERTANKVIKQGLGDVIKHNRSHLMRLYPNVTRLTSSNYEPTRYWASGAQLVSINWQSTGTSSQGPRQSAQRISDRPLAPQTRASGSTAPCLRVTAAAATFSNRPTSASRIRRRRTRQRAARCMSRC